MLLTAFSLLPAQFCLAMLEYPEQTTTLSQPSSGFVTITHPYHPLYDQQVEVVRLRRGVQPTLIIRTPAGHHLAIAMESTDYLVTEEVAAPVVPPHLLDIEGLWHIARFIAHLR
jgi:hypothetical protein